MRWQRQIIRIILKIISTDQQIEHYEIASQGTLCQFAETLILTAAVDLLEQTLQVEKAADEKLTEVAVSAVNVKGAEQLLEVQYLTGVPKY